ncbi:protein NETWORKED 4B-like [Durio zibethinus]|uniref:Protein NETWORKED 4B-like n=1 Tax=Durio zibethinus TaxID=66656 RepID=A0A6P6AJ53_DURZI|nr:protein NETWORKED 4B-like [Durio zibethinus]
MEPNMKNAESKNSKLCRWDSHLTSENAEWLAEKSKEMDQSVKQVLKFVVDNMEGLAKNDDMHSQNKSEVIVHVQELYRIYQSLAERYDHLTRELRKSLPSDCQTQGPDSGFDQNSPLITPDKKLGMGRSSQQAASFSSGGGSSDLSLKERTETSSFSSDSDSESFSSSVNIYLSSPVDNDNGGVHHKVTELGSELPTMKLKLQGADGENVDGKLKMGDNRSYEELNERLNNREEELGDLNLKLHLAEEEIARLNTELKKNESVSVLSDHMLVRLESLQGDTKTREADLELENGKVLELQKQIVELEAHVSVSNSEIVRLMEELAASKEKIKASEEEIAMFKHELGQKISDDTRHVLGQLESAQEDLALLKAQLDIERTQAVNLQEQIVRYSNDLSNRGREIEELKGALCDAHDNFSMQRASFQSEIFGLLEKETLLEARLKEWELHQRLLEEKLNQCEAEKREIKGLHDVREIGFQGQISQLKAELLEKGVHVEALNKNLDLLKLKYDMLMAEKDGVIAKVNTLVAEVSSRDVQIGQMEEHIQQLSREHLQLISGLKYEKNLEDELKLRIKDLEKEVDRQRIMILDVAEEKREVIRQLSFTLEHYRSGYKEYQAFFKHNQYAIKAS